MITKYDGNLLLAEDYKSYLVGPAPHVVKIESNYLYIINPIRISRSEKRNK